MLASSTPDALWSAPSLRTLRPATVECRDVSSGRLLDRCSLSLTVGQRLLLVGDPAASASHLVRVLAGLVRPRRGAISVAGIAGPASAAGGRRAAYVARRPGLPPWMTPREALQLAATLVGLSGEPARLAVGRAAARVSLPRDAMEAPLAAQAADVAERTDLAAALVGDPEVLLLDEPLPSVVAAERLELLRFEEGDRRTIVLTSRAPERDAVLASDIALVREGRVALQVPLSELRAAGRPPLVEPLIALAARRPRPQGTAEAREPEPRR